MKRRNAIFRWAAAAGPLAIVTACQPAEPPAQKPISLEEAKTITASFEGAGFVAPPRTINDITAILDQEKPDPAERARAIARADAQPPAGLGGTALADFYRVRSGDALTIGRISQALEDARRAQQIHRDASPGGPGSGGAIVLNAVAVAEEAIGHGKGARRVRERTVENANNPNPRIEALFGMVRVTATSGDFAAAQRYLADSDAQTRELAARRGPGRSPAARAFYDLVSQHFNARAHAALAAAQGSYGEAETWLRTAIGALDRALDGYGAAASESRLEPLASYQAYRLEILNAIADSLLWQGGRLLEAEAASRQALLYSLKQFGRASQLTAISVSELARVLFEENRLADAEKLYREALVIARAAGAPGRVISFTLADTVAAQGRAKEAYEIYERTVSEAGGETEIGDKWRSLARINVYRLTGHVAEAVALGRHRLALVSKAQGEDSYQAAEARGTLAAALAASGNRNEALREYERAVIRLLRTGAGEDSSDGITRREWRLRGILAGYVGLLAETVGETAQRGGVDPAEEAFRIADAARGGAVDQAFAAEASRANLRDGELADLARREQDAQKQLAARRGLLANELAQPTEEQDAAAIGALRGEIDRLQGARSQLQEQIAKRSPGYAQFLEPHPATVAEARARLRDGEALVATFVAGDKVLVWALGKTGPLSFAVAPIAPGALARDVATLRRSLDPGIASLADIPAFDVALAHRLYAALLEPVAAGWRGAGSLIVVPHGALGQIPLGLLVTAPTPAAAAQPGEALFASYRRVPFLARSVAITQLPSASALGTLRALPPGAAGRRAFVGFGDPWFSQQQAEAAAEGGGSELALATRGLHLRAAPKTEAMSSAELSALPRLPDTADEVRQVAAALQADPQQDVFLGSAASEGQVRRMKLDDRRVVMFATHGLVPGDLDGLTEPALALAAPGLAGGSGDGLLTMAKILGLKLDADWVVLSACNTAAGSGAGAEAVSGLGRAFFYAGARAVLVTNWPVETSAARLLTTDTFRRQAADSRLSRAEALRQAELALIDGPGAQDAGGRALFSYAHPIFWAPFSLVGDGG